MNVNTKFYDFGTNKLHKATTVSNEELLLCAHVML